MDKKNYGRENSNIITTEGDSSFVHVSPTDESKANYTMKPVRDNSIIKSKLLSSSQLNRVYMNDMERISTNKEA